MSKFSWDQAFSDGAQYRPMNNFALAKILDEVPKIGKALDIGCGTGDLALQIASFGYDVTGIDGSKVAIENAHSKAIEAGVINHVTFIHQDIDDQDLPTGSYALITAKLVIAFIDYKKLFKKVSASLMHDGVFMVQTPLMVRDVNYPDNDETRHLKRISVDESELSAALNANFKTVEILTTEYSGHWGIDKTYVAKSPSR